MIKFFIEYIFVFITGALMGWGIEVVYRRYFGLAKKWINPGFLSGPYLPLYGSALCVLYIISKMSMDLWIKIVLFAFVTTFFEYVTGLFFLKIYKTRLWDYTKLRFNVQGIIAPLYTLFWTLLSMVFYFVLYPFFYNKVQFLYEHLEFSLLVGFVLGIVFVDVIQSFNVLHRLRKVVKQLEESKFVIQYDELKMEIQERFRERPVKVNFMFPFKGEFNLADQVKAHINKFKDEIEELRNELRL